MGRCGSCLVPVGPLPSLSPGPSPGTVLPLSVLWLFQGNLRPEEALQALTIYEGKFGRLKDDREKCAKAKEALELTDTGLLSGSEERVQVRTVSAKSGDLLHQALPPSWSSEGPWQMLRWFFFLLLIYKLL